jgi:serine/threonine-protein kinase HipA
MRRLGRVHLDDRPVGWLEETEDGVSFRYDPAYLESPGALPVSPTLPLQKETYEGRALPPFFLGLLPEGWFLELAAARAKVDRADRFGLLLATGRDCAGAVWVVDATMPEGGARG